MTATTKDTPRKQADRSKATRQALIDAAIEALVEVGYARTTAVEVCNRAGVTRGALFHHFESLPALLAAALSDTYDRLFLDDKTAAHDSSLEQWVGHVWRKVAQPEFKALIEIWLASRNDPDATAEIQPAIERYKTLFSPENNPKLTARLTSRKERTGFYRMTIETMIGMALGRATTPGGRPLDHESIVLDQLKAYARALDTA